MDDPTDPTDANAAREFTTAVEAKVARKVSARSAGAQGVWLGLGMMGLVGWSVVIPTLLGAALGIFIDRHHPSDHSWTLALLIAGLTIGCAVAGQRIVTEYRAMHTDQDQDHEHPHD
jgi:ATP synthase protein I